MTQLCTTHSVGFYDKSEYASVTLGDSLWPVCIHIGSLCIVIEMPAVQESRERASSCWDYLLYLRYGWAISSSGQGLRGESQSPTLYHFRAQRTPLKPLVAFHNHTQAPGSALPQVLCSSAPLQNTHQMLTLIKEHHTSAWQLLGTRGKCAMGKKDFIPIAI